MSKNFPYYHQLDAMDCGPTCLRMVAKHYGKHYSLETLWQKSFIGREGVSMLGISTAAESIGFRTIGVHISFEQLAEVSPRCSSPLLDCSLAKRRRTATIRNCINDMRPYPQPNIIADLFWLGKNNLADLRAA